MPWREGSSCRLIDRIYPYPADVIAKVADTTGEHAASAAADWRTVDKSC